MVITGAPYHHQHAIAADYARPDFGTHARRCRQHEPLRDMCRDGRPGSAYSRAHRELSECDRRADSRGTASLGHSIVGTRMITLCRYALAGRIPRRTDGRNREPRRALKTNWRPTRAAKCAAVRFRWRRRGAGFSAIGVRPIGSFSGSAASFCLLDAPAAAQASRRVMSDE
jgi:hypothetical protein